MSLVVSFISLVPRPRPAFRRLKYFSFARGESLEMRLVFHYTPRFELKDPRNVMQYTGQKKCWTFLVYADKCLIKTCALHVFHVFHKLISSNST